MGNSRAEWMVWWGVKDKLSLNCRGVAAAEVEGVFWCVMDRTGECEKFQSRVDRMVGGGGGGGADSACVITREDNGLVSQGRQRTGQSASGEQQMRRQPSKK